ncbi:pilus assembly protein N-terminal domain-containing protein [Castellaniella sp. GW247-6E4]|uniref:type II and III secretion system protein family protein n=1 Tax=Castellaniella sp. GW247-6E4 TaxID=3140380 RepID=UPI003314D77C
MSPGRRLWKAGSRALCCAYAASRMALTLADTTLPMQVGEVRVLGIPDAARVAVGDGQVLKAISTDDHEVIVFARRGGSSALHVWSADGHVHRYMVEVAAEGARQLQNELRGVVERIPGARVSAVGDKLLVEGDDLSDADRQRVADLVQRYPQLLDFTGTVGWDRMVLLDVQVVEVPRSLARDLGLRWAARPEGGVNASVAWDSGSTRHADRPGETIVPIGFPARALAGYFGINALLSARIDALAQEGHAVVLAQPQLLARSGATAEFLAGGEVPYSTVDQNGQSRTAFKPYGVSLRITPSVERGGAVRSRIEVEVSSIDTALSVPEGPSLKTRRAATEFNVRSGETLVLAGFLSRDVSSNVDKIPGLSDLPVLGALFRSTRFQRNETELAILVTPVLVSAQHPGVRRRADRASSILNRAFPDPPRLMLPISQDVPEPEPTDGLVRWNPRSRGPGSQWRDGTEP